VCSDTQRAIAPLAGTTQGVNALAGRPKRHQKRNASRTRSVKADWLLRGRNGGAAEYRRKG